MHRLMRVAACSIVSVCAQAGAQPLTTAFTFQGQLKSGNNVASGTYDFRFTLFDALTGGTQLGPQLCSDNVSVTGGLVTVQLDFGAWFVGSQRFLEVQVREDTGLTCASAAGFTALAPRQAVTAGPYAQYSLNAGAATSAASAANATQLSGHGPAFYQDAGNLVTGTVPDGRLGGTYTGAVNLANAGNAFAGNGPALTNLNASAITTGTISSSRLPVPLSLSGTSPTEIIRGLNDSGANGSTGIFGRALAVSGITNGVSGETDSSTDAACGVIGQAGAHAGQTFGVLGLGDSRSDGSAGVRGVAGEFVAGTGKTYGVWGETQSPHDLAAGVYGLMGNSSGGGYGVYGENAANSGGVGVSGFARGTGGACYGVEGFANSDVTMTAGVKGSVQGGTGMTFGVHGLNTSSNPEAAGVYGQYDNPDGTGCGVRGETTSTIAGEGVLGRSGGGTGVTYGVHGFGGSSGSDSAAVFGENTVVGDAFTEVYGVYGTTRAISAFSAGVYGKATSTSSSVSGVRGESTSPTGTGVWGIASGTTGKNTGMLGETHSTVSGSSGVWGIDVMGPTVTYGVIGQTQSTAQNAAGLRALGNGVAGAGSPKGAALRIENGAITVAGPTKAADKIQINGWTCFYAWDDTADCNNVAYGKAPIGAYSVATISNNLIRSDSLIYLTVRGTPPTPGIACYAQVTSQSPGFAIVRVTVLGGGPPCQLCSYAGPPLDLNYLIINPQ